MKLRGATCVALILALMCLPTAAHAQAKAGTSCSKSGAVTKVSGSTFTCFKSGKGLVWTKVSTTVKRSPAASQPAAKLKQVLIVSQKKSIDIAVGKVTALFTSNSKLPVSMQVTTPAVCRVQDLSILLLQTGTCTVEANQSGNDKYLPASPISFSFDVTAPNITSDNALFDEVQTFIRVPMGAVYASDTAEITLTSITDDASAKVCADDATAPGCISQNGAGVPDPAADTRYVEFAFHVKNLDPNPLPTITYQLLVKGVLSDVDTAVSLQDLNELTVESGQSADGSFFSVIPKDLKLDNGYLVINEGITDSTVRLLFALSN